MERFQNANGRFAGNEWKKIDTSRSHDVPNLSENAAAVKYPSQESVKCHM
jgi:hypothetical protein